MTGWEALRRSEDFEALLAVSERLGRDPLQVQAAGGNTSLKSGGAMWVKASGTWLAEARTRDIMVPVDAAGLRDALDGPREDRDFVPEELNPGGLRPSIETSFHAALDWPVVLHTHSVATIAVAVLRDAADVVAERLGDLGAVFVPYCMPGRELTRAILAAATPSTRVIVLGNHGLICCADTPVEAEALLREVSKRLDRAPDPLLCPPEGFSEELEGTGWMPAPEEASSLALDPEHLAIAEGATLYPDHAIFLGPGIVVADSGRPLCDVLDEVGRMQPARRLVLVPGQGAAIQADASPGTLALARALGDVVLRIEPGADLSRLSAAQEAALLNWDAEKYRQSLEAQR